MQLLEVPIAEIHDVPAPKSKARQLSFGEMGQITPVKLRMNGTGYKVVEGRRRVADLRAMGQATVLALVEEMDELQAARESLASNVCRSHNPMSEAKDAAILRAAGLSQQEIANAVGCTQGLISQRLSLIQKLIPELQSRLEVGTMTFSAARIAVKLPAQDQLELSELDRITIKEVKARLATFKAEALDLDNLGVPDAPENYTPGIVLSGEKMEQLANGEPVTIEWREQTITIITA